MAATRLDSFSSPVRKAYFSQGQKADQSNSDTDESFDEHDLEDLDLQAATECQPPDAVIDVEPENQQSLEEDDGEGKEPVAKDKTNKCCAPPLQYVVFFLSICCAVFVVSTAACQIAVSTPLAPSVLLGATILLMTEGIWALLAKHRLMILVFGCLLIVEMIATMAFGSVETRSFRDNFLKYEALNDQLSHSPEEEKEMNELVEKLKLLAAFVALYFLCSILVLVTAILDFMLYADIRRSKGQSGGESSAHGKGHDAGSAGHQRTGELASSPMAGDGSLMNDTPQMDGSADKS